MTAGSNTHRKDQACALQLLKETKQQLLRLVKIGKEETTVWLHSCHRRIAKQVAMVCFSVTLREKIHLAGLMEQEATRGEDSCCIGHRKENQVESKPVRKNDSSFTKEEEPTEDRANADSSSNAKPKDWKLKLIGKVAKLKCGRQLCSTNNDVP